jgi:hypothetical protein
LPPADLQPADGGVRKYEPLHYSISSSDGEAVQDDAENPVYPAMETEEALLQHALQVSAEEARSQEKTIYR